MIVVAFFITEGVPDGKAIILSVDGNFHGRTLGVIGMRWVEI
jgi:acetylornithine/succinyldiaminopimelate/putrescine aminotransferase